MRQQILDILLPPTDRMVAIQSIVMTIFWFVTIIAVRHRSKDIRTFIFGLAMINLAWFAARLIH